MSVWLLADLAILLLIGGFGYFAMKRGFLKSSYGGISNLVALVLVFSFHIPFQAYLEHSAIGETVRDKIQTSIETSLYANPDIDTKNPDSQTAVEVIDSMKLPQFLTSWLTDIIQSQANQYDKFKSNLIDDVTNLIFPPVMQILSIILLYLLLRIGLWLFFLILKLVVEFPLVGAADKLLGAISGGINALLIIYIVSALIMLLTPVNLTQSMENGINSTFIYKYFYFNNLITNLFFK